MFEIQTAIPTIDRTVMEDILWSQFHVHGVAPEVATTMYKGVPLYLLRCKDGISYVCTRGQALYFMKQMSHYVDFTLYSDPVAFRVFPPMANMQHREKGCQYGVTYVSLAKSHEYAEHAVLPI